MWNFFFFNLSLLLDYKLYDLDCDLSSNENRFYVIRLFVQNKELNQKKKKKNTPANTNPNEILIRLVDQDAVGISINPLTKTVKYSRRF